MQKISTIHLFIQSLYETLPLEELRKVEVLTNTERKKWIEMKEKLPQIELSPSQQSIDAILSYSKQTSKLDPIM